MNFAGYHYCETDVIGVELPGTDQPHVSICKAVMQAEVNIHYMHPMIYRRNGHGAIAVYVDDVDETLRVLGEAGHRSSTENDLLMDDEFFD